MTSPCAGIPKQYILSASIKPPFTEYEASAKLSLEPPLVPPATYHYLHLDWWGSARIVAVPPDPPSNRNRETSPLIADVPEPTCSPFATICARLAGCGSAADRRIGGYSELADSFDPPPTSLTRFIRRTGATTYTLLEESGDWSEFGDEKGIIDFEIEAWFGTTSTFTKTDDLAKRALLWKANGLNPWWSSQRTLDDFDNVRYSCNTAACSGTITLTRLSDDSIMARFILPNKFIWGVLGTLQVLEPVPEDLLELIFCAIYVKYLRDEVSTSFP